MNGIQRKSGIERALIAVDAQGIPVILATDGAWITNDMDELGTDAQQVGLVVSKEIGIPDLYLWEGTAEMVNVGAPLDPVEMSVEYTGTLRRVQPEEVATLYAMTPPEPDEEADEPIVQ